MGRRRGCIGRLEQLRTLSGTLEDACRDTGDLEK